MSRHPGASPSFFTDWSTSNANEPEPRHVDTSTRRPAAASTLRARIGAARGRLVALGMVAASAAAVGLVAPGSPATADPSPHTWYRLRMCESSNNYRTDTGNGYYGAYQFDLGTWRSVGGSGYPNLASPAEQDARALILYRMRGWQPWTCASILGLREDSDARSGRTGDIRVGSARRPSGIPAFPGSRWYRYGDWNGIIKRFQDEMHKRGFFPVGTGQYGPNTRRMVLQLQRLNGLIPNGYIGPNTWRLAWVGRYTPPTGTAPSPPPPTRSGVPAFPGSRWYHYGDWNNVIKTFQDQMHKRGFFPVGTGQYGPNTRRMILQLQRLNGLIPNGYLGPNTWRLAWVGRYTEPPAPSSTPTTSSVPAFPGTRWYHYGDWNGIIKRFQDQMHKRGYFPVGTGQYGPNTRRMILQLQRLNGLIPNGYLGPQTWRLAWVGKYTPPAG